MRPLVLNFLAARSAADLMTEHGVRLAHGSRPHKASLNYDQIAARDTDPLACQCRGLVVGRPDGSPIPSDGPVGPLVVLARPMDRFFNLGQGAAHAVTGDDLAHPEVRVMEKVDGTLCIVYFDPAAGEWCVATRSVPDADRPVDGFGDHTFASLFKTALRDHLGLTWGHFVKRLDPAWTYCFELTSPRAGSGVVRYDEHRVHLLAVRHVETGEEACPTTFDLPPVRPRASWSASPDVRRTARQGQIRCLRGGAWSVLRGRSFAAQPLAHHPARAVGRRGAALSSAPARARRPHRRGFHVLVSQHRRRLCAAQERARRGPQGVRGGSAGCGPTDGGVDVHVDRAGPRFSGVGAVAQGQGGRLVGRVPGHPARLRHGLVRAARLTWRAARLTLAGNGETE